ncbi:hypothetical protein [Rhizobium metallidurans]|uniref:Uncharacterized protein n=1 Tax=Rhizobium metallidurans TaxID=1265931 RepID=A0A7W6GBG4_9HYPH|nr:hypothetical protein [Rhizobium metallidurans]MBB3963596.1 hypothetical protein [Rhizobium metallidurans]
MKFFGIILILFGLPLSFIPIIGIPMIIIGFIMILSSIGSSNADKTAQALAKQMTTVRQQPAPVPANNAEAERWAALAKYDDDVRGAVEALEPLGSAAIDKLSATYLALNDKTKLPRIVADIQAEFGRS